MSHERNKGARLSRRNAYILGGGESSRFGVDKATYELDGVPMWRLVADSVSPAVDEIVVVVREFRDDIELRQVVDRRSGRGPLVGIEAALSDASKYRADALVVGCDLLGLQAEWAEPLFDALDDCRAAAFRNDYWQSVFSAWRPDALPPVRDALERSDGAVWRLLESIARPLATPAGWDEVVVANTRDAADSFVSRSAPTRRVPVVDIAGEQHLDDVAVEEPLEIRLETIAFGRRQTRPISVTMRTPGNDHELAVGFLCGEGILTSSDEVESVLHCDDGANPNVVNVRLAADVEVDFARLQRNFYTTSSCGVCGKTSLEALEVIAAPVRTVELEPDVVTALPDRLRDHQNVFDMTGAIHGAGLFTQAGEMVLVREDVGRHNALDKVVGARFLAGENLDGHVVVLSGRASFELLQKALVGRAGAVVAVGAPSSLAVELARTNDIALYGFVRGGRFNRYA